MATPTVNRTHDLPPLAMRAAFAPATMDSERRTVQLTWTTGARVLRGGFFSEPFYEQLSLDPKHVRMGRLRAGAPLLDSHRANSINDVLGLIESAALESGRGVATVQFERGAAGDEAMRKVADGIVRGVSVGYGIHKLVKLEESADKVPVYEARDWEPFELTLAHMGADAGASVRSADNATNPCDFEERVVDNEDSTDTNPPPSAHAQ